jgi:CHAT domain-containing protein
MMVKILSKQVIHFLSLGLVMGLWCGGQGAIAQTSEGGEGPITQPPVEEVPTPDTGSQPDSGILHDLSNTNPSEITPTVPGGGTTVKTPTFVGDPIQIVEQVETYQSQPYANHLGLNFYGNLASGDQIAQTLKNLAQKTGTNPALVYVLSSSKGLKLVLVSSEDKLPSSPTSFRLPRLDWRLASTQPWALLAQQDKTPATTPNFTSFLVPEATSSALKRTVKSFRNQISDPSKNTSDGYRTAAKQLYDWIVTPLKPTLEARRIDTLVFSLDKGFRTMPVAALYDGKQFLVEQYNLALIPSFSLTDTRYQDIRGSKMLGMGITQSAGGLSPLPAVSVEVPTLTEKIWQGTGYLDQQVTLEQFQALAQREQFSIVHLATHAEFNPGNPNKSFIQFWDGRLTLPKLRSLALSQKWSATPTLEMLVLSACQTALGNDQAELGFTGLAVQTGVKTAIGSLWSVSDEGTLGLMSEFYRNLKTAPIRAAALREAQIGLLSGKVKVANGKLLLADGTQVDLPESIASRTNIDLSHPYFWAPYTVVGNWN